MLMLILNILQIYLTEVIYSIQFSVVYRFHMETLCL